MTQYIDKSAVVAEIKERMDRNNEMAASFSGGSETDYFYRVKESVYKDLLSFLDTLEVKDPYEQCIQYSSIKKDSELIANNIMIGVQANKYHTCVYNTTRCDFNHSHLMLAARKGIELGLKVQKGE